MRPAEPVVARSLGEAGGTLGSLAALALAGGCALVMGYDDYQDAPGSGPSGAGGASSSSSAPSSSSASTTGGEGGEGGERLPCEEPTDCPGVEDECQTRACEDSFCSAAYQPDGTAVTEQVEGDCRQNVCDGNGVIDPRPDDADRPPDDGNACTLETCEDGEPRTVNAEPGTLCGAGNGLTCNGEGVCQGCTTAAQCGDDGECFTRACKALQCSQAPRGEGTLCGPGTSCSAGVFELADTCAGIVCADGGTASCLPYVCADAASCFTACNDDGACADGYFCHGNGTCVEQRELGASCFKTSQCLSGFCEDGVCCDVACSELGPCHRCRADLQEAGGVDGFCAFAETGSSCNAGCIDDHRFATRQCTPAGGCEGVQFVTDCGFFACDDGACGTTCFGNVDCATGARCEAPSCCATCSMILDPNGSVARPAVCSTSSDVLDPLVICACQASCTPACSDFCNDTGPVSVSCASCLSAVGCTAELGACQQDDD